MDPDQLRFLRSLTTKRGIRGYFGLEHEARIVVQQAMEEYRQRYEHYQNTREQAFEWALQKRQQLQAWREFEKGLEKAGARISGRTKYELLLRTKLDAALRRMQEL